MQAKSFRFRPRAYHEKRRYQPTASRITSGSNWRHLNSPEIDGARSIGPAYQVKPPNLQRYTLVKQSPFSAWK